MTDIINSTLAGITERLKRDDLTTLPTNIGKGVSIVIPNLLAHPDSVVVNDINFENWELTARFKAN